MGVDYKVSQIYDAGMKQVVSSEKDWKSVCRLTGRLYRYEFDNILMIYMQRPNATLVADYDTWKDPRVGRYVKRGSRNDSRKSMCRDWQKGDGFCGWILSDDTI